MRTIKISTQLELERLPEIFKGNLVIDANSCLKSNLKIILGSLKINSKFFAPKIKKILGGLEVNSEFISPALEECNSDVIINFKYSPTKLQKIAGNLKVSNELECASLLEVGKYLWVQSKINAPKLIRVKKCINIFHDNNEMRWEGLTKMWIDFYPIQGQYFRYSKNKYLFNGIHDLKFYVSIIKLQHNSFQNFITREVNVDWVIKGNLIGLLNIISSIWSSVQKMKIIDIFRIEDLRLRRFCFLYLLPRDLMKHLKAKRIATDGIEMNYFKYINEQKVPMIKNNIYEVYEADSNLIDSSLSGSIYAVKCWCTSTNKEAWLWIDQKYKNDPLSAIASTFVVHENIIPYIKCLKRQGDILIVEMTKEVTPNGIERPLTKNEYFNLLKCET